MGARQRRARRGDRPPTLRLAVALVTGQALLLSAVALAEAATGADVAAALALLLRATALGALFLFLVSRTREARPVRAGVAPFARAGLAVALALLPWLVPEIGLESRDSERAVLALVAFRAGLRGDAEDRLFQVLGIVLVENGLALAALELPGGSSSLAISSASPSTSRSSRSSPPSSTSGSSPSSAPATPRRSEGLRDQPRGARRCRRRRPALGPARRPRARRAVTAVATGAALVTCALAIALSAVAFTGQGPFVGDWIVVDAAAGLLIGVM